MAPIEIEIEIILALLVLVAALVTIARRTKIPYPILLVIGGLALGFVPGLPSVVLDPQIVFLLFLPPLLYWESLNTSFRDFRFNLRSITLLSIGLVLATTVVVGIVVHLAIPEMSWPTAFLLGAIISPTDTVAAAAIAQRLVLPRRIVVLLEGESLVNDATALVAYGVALASIGGSSFNLLHAGLQFVLVSVGGIVIGLIVGWCIGRVRRYLHDPPVENTISLLSGFAAYIPAQVLGVSGVLSVVATGIYLGRLGPRIVSSQTRLQAGQMWEVITFLLNGLLFILVGLQLHPIILAALEGHSVLTLLGYAALVSLAVILVRIAWVFPGAYLPFALSSRVRKREPVPSWESVVIVGWTGMRGGVSLAAALALPINLPGRALIIFLTFCVIFSTLIVQGLSLPPLIRWLRPPDDGREEHEESKARLKVARAALARLDALASEDWVEPDVVEDLRSHYADQSRRYAARFDGDGDNTGQEKRAKAHLRLKRELIRAERNALLELRNRDFINDDVLRRIQRELDLEEIRYSS